MEITIEEISPLTRKMKIVLPEETVGKALDAAYRKLKSEVNIKGFRKGKVPQSILEKNYGHQVKSEVGEKLIQDTYFDAVEQEKLDPVVHPEITSANFTSEGSFVYEAEIDVRPSFALGTYKGLEIDKPEINVSDEEIDNELKRLQKEMAPLQSAEDGHVTQNGDIVVVDFQGFDNGEPLKQVYAEKASVDVGSGRNGERFENNLIGLKKGEEKSFDIEFPADTPNPFLAGKTVEFRVAVNDIKIRIETELDDDFAKDVGKEFETLEALRIHIREKMMREKETSAEGDLSDQMMLKLLENHVFEVPKRLVRYEIEEYIKQAEDNLKRSGLNLESAGINRNELAEKYRDSAEKRVRGDFILKKISEQEELKVADEDLTKGFERIGKQYNMSVEEVKGYFKSRDDLLPFMNELLNEKIINFLLAEAKINVVSGAGIKDNVHDQAAEQPADS